MLTRNSQIEKLLEEGDFNVRVTIYDPTQVSKDPKKQKAAWLEAIRDSIGGGIVNSNEHYKLDVQNINRMAAIRCTTDGLSIIDIIDSLYDKPESIRISISHTSDTSKVRHWIIA